ncbi:dynein axonemal assembly factor 3 homolog [Lucilia cuprina]|uniref:dynein axonemal assembly factor 3 homolog n=1 Tax=Lucilia cuprina TaxID=7375 RepID=UPI001F05908F|nr:dynein axonemal assembly factor 3 homolog [Lucilia cuprina]
MFWGLSEALDLFSEYLNIFKYKDESDSQEDKEKSSECQHGNSIPLKEEINILLFGANDPRHVIKTMAKIYTHKLQEVSTTLNFYIIDGCIEVVARNMVLIGIALESPEILNLRTKVHLFMDIYGNALMRASSCHYLEVKTRSLLNAVTDEVYLHKMIPMFNIDHMKYRERDGLETSFSFWLSKQHHIFKIEEYWNGRLKKLMGERYDYREGQFDWDLNMVLKERKGNQICSQEYRYWRETGIAFTFPEYEYSKSNKTLSAGLIRNGNQFIHRGYIGDIQTGPFVAFGLSTNDERMNKSIHGENDYRSTDITERNLLELFHELATQTIYNHDVTQSRKYGSIRLKMANRLIHNEADTKIIKDYDKPWINIDRVKIHFLSSDDILALQKNVNGQWSTFFDIAFVGHNYFTFLQDSFVNVLSAQSLLIMETKLLSTSRKEVINDFEEKLFDFAKRNHFHDVINYKALNMKNSFLKFKRTFNLSQ